jgi:hypothetical protein
LSASTDVGLVDCQVGTDENGKTGYPCRKKTETWNGKAKAYRPIDRRRTERA